MSFMALGLFKLRERGFNGQGRTVFGIEGLRDFHVTVTKPYPRLIGGCNDT